VAVVVSDVRFDIRRNIRIFTRKGYIMLDLETDKVNSSITGISLPVQTYDTWYAFKKDLESLCGHPILNRTWLQIKPQTALPWGKSQILTALSKLS
jgi:hypothetical protein